MSFSPPAVLAFAASDPTSGAGLQADLLTIAALRAYPLEPRRRITIEYTMIDGVNDAPALALKLADALAGAAA